MIRVLLIVPPLPERSYPGKFMGLDYIAGFIKDISLLKILDLDVWDSRREFGIEKESFENKLKKEIKTFSPQIVGITNLSIQNDIANYIAYLVKKIDKEILTIKGGPHETTSGYWTILLHHEYVDGSAVGEGEELFKELIETYENTKKEKITKWWQEKKYHIKGLWVWEGNSPHFTGERDLLNLDDDFLNIPYRNNYFEEYNFDIFGYPKWKTAQIITTRGCPYRCNFCFECIRGRRLRYRNIEALKRELDFLKKENYKALYFDDSTFTLPRNRFQQIIELLKDYSFKWGFNTRVDQIDPEQIKMARQTGLVYMFCGVESFVPGVLLALNKTDEPDTYIRKIHNSYKIMNELGLLDNVFLIFGNAKKEDGNITREDWKDIIHSLDGAVDLDVSYISMNILRLLPEIPFSTEEKFGILRPRGEKIEGKHYDSKWYLVSGEKDLRSYHPVLRCFEGALSVNSTILDSTDIYGIVSEMVRKVNRKNSKSKNQTKIIVDKAAGLFFRKNNLGGKIYYKLESLSRIPKSIRLNTYMKNWKKINEKGIKI